MKTNLIQNYTYSTQLKGSSKKEKPEFSIQNELDNKTFIKPLDSRGHLVNNRIIDIPANTVKSIAYDAKSLKHGIKGKANDHELGKLNDIGMKLGGLAVAAYLFTRKQTLLTKTMEFVGLGSFFGAMALWPKVAINLPARAIHGVNVGQNYEDSFGRKKPFYQDSQFLPWSLYSDKKIDKIGNRLGVPQDMQNRRDYTQEKMKKIALQNNTLWMLTAGFATPIFSAITCNLLEEPIRKYQSNLKNKKANAMLEHFDESAKARRSKQMLNDFEKLIELHRDKAITDNVFDNIANVFTKGFDLVTADGIEKDLKSMLLQDNFTIDKTVVKDVVKNMHTALEGGRLDADTIEAVVPTEEDLTKIFRNKKYLGNDFEPKQFRQIMGTIMEPLKENIKNFNVANPSKLISEELIINKLINHNLAESPIGSALTKLRALKLDSRNQAVLRNFANILTDFKSQVDVLDEYTLIKVGSAPETVLANYWNDVSSTLTKSMKISPKEIANARYDKSLMADLVRGKIEKIASNPADYERVVKVLTEKMEHLESLINHSSLTETVLSSSSDNPLYNQKVAKVFTDADIKLRNIGMEKTASRIFGGSDTLQGVQLSMVSDRLLGVKSSFLRLLNTLDFYRRVATLENVPALHNGMPREVKEELVELCKKMTLQGHAADFSTKFYQLRNPNPNLSDYSQIEIKDGQVINKYMGQMEHNAVDIPNDSKYFKESMKLMFENPLHSDTQRVFGNKTSVTQELNAYRTQVLEKIGNLNYFAKPQHCATALIGEADNAPSDLRFLLTGISPDELFSNVGKQSYNTRQWLKMFGGLGIGLLGATVLAQFFFGKMDNPKQVQKGN